MPELISSMWGGRNNSLGEGDREFVGFLGQFGEREGEKKENFGGAKPESRPSSVKGDFFMGEGGRAKNTMTSREGEKTGGVLP